MNVDAKLKKDFESCINPGDFYIKNDRLSFLCPCGCGLLAAISITGKNAWDFNGNLEKPTASPSILINQGHWHGYLTDGVFREC